MSQTMRVLLLVSAVVTAFWILFKIRKLKVKMEDAIFWTVFALVLTVMGLFPEVTYWLTSKLGVMSPANLIFLIMIFLLFEKVFTLSIIVSMLEEKITVLSAEIALRTHQSEKEKQESIQERDRENAADERLQQASRDVAGQIGGERLQQEAGGEKPGRDQEAGGEKPQQNQEAAGKRTEKDRADAQSMPEKNAGPKESGSKKSGSRPRKRKHRQ